MCYFLNETKQFFVSSFFFVQKIQRRVRDAFSFFVVNCCICLKKILLETRWNGTNSKKKTHFDRRTHALMEKKKTKKYRLISSEMVLFHHKIRYFPLIRYHADWWLRRTNLQVSQLIIQWFGFLSFFLLVSI